MFGLSIKGPESLVEKVWEMYEKACKKHGPYNGGPIVETTMEYDLVKGTMVEYHSKVIKQNKWKTITFCMPALKDYQETALESLESGTIGIDLGQQRYIPAHAYQHNRFIFAIRTQEHHLKDAEYDFLFGHKKHRAYFKLIGVFEGLGLLEGKLGEEVNIKPIIGSSTPTELSNLFAIDSQVKTRIKRLNAATMRGEYIELDQPTISGSIIFCNSQAIGIAAVDPTKAIRWSNLPGFEMQLQKGMDFQVQTLPVKGIGLFVKAVGRLNPLSECIGFGSLILDVSSSSELFRIMANKQWTFMIKNGPVEPVAQMTTFRE